MEPEEDVRANALGAFKLEHAFTTAEWHQMKQRLLKRYAHPDTMAVVIPYGELSESEVHREKELLEELGFLYFSDHEHDAWIDRDRFDSHAGSFLGTLQIVSMSKSFLLSKRRLQK